MKNIPIIMIVSYITIARQVPSSRDYKPPLAVYTIVVLASGDSQRA